MNLRLSTISGIGCAGEIRISPHDDYDKWAIDILVKFRDNEKLQLLTGQRQSGGVSKVKFTRCMIFTLCSGTVTHHYLIPHEFD